MNLSELADLIEAFADANDEFKQIHSEDPQSDACWTAYECKQTARVVLDDALTDILEAFPRELSAALRKKTPLLTEEQP